AVEVRMAIIFSREMREFAAAAFQWVKLQAFQAGGEFGRAPQDCSASLSARLTAYFWEHTMRFLMKTEPRVRMLSFRSALLVFISPLCGIAWGEEKSAAPPPAMTTALAQVPGWSPEDLN